MMKSRELKRIAIQASLFIITTLASSAGRAEDLKKPQAAWPQKMRGIEKAFQELLIDLNSDERFNSPKNFSRIEKNTAGLSKLVHSLKSKGAQSPDSDPSIQLIATLFSEQAEQAHLALAEGHRPYARQVLKSLMSYCVACHTRSNTGPSFTAVAQNSPLIDSLKNVEKADYFASVRQFDRSIEEYESLIKNSAYASDRPFEWVKAVRSALAIAIRVKKDPERALAVLDKALSTPEIPYFIQEEAVRWKMSLNAWKSEKKPTLKTEDEYFAEANRLMTLAISTQKYPADRGADMLYLRASSVIHDLLSFAPDGKYAVDALYMAGQSYEVLSSMNLNEMHEFYYLSCVLKAPHTEKSRQCYRSYEQSVYLGYTGSSGTRIPKKIRERLNKLDLLSNPQNTKVTAPPKEQLQ